MSRPKRFISPSRNWSIGQEAKIMSAIADYHLKNIFDAVQDYQREDSEIHLYAHVRAFFWELYSIGELVNRSNVQQLKDLKNSEEWKEWWGAIYEYRNSAHAAFFEIQVLIPEALRGSSNPDVKTFLLTDSPSVMRGEIDFLLPAAKRSPVQAQFPQIPNASLLAPSGKDYLSRLLKYASTIILPKFQ